MISDTFDYEYYPEPVMPDQKIDEVVKDPQYNQPMIRIVEVFDLTGNFDKQVAEERWLKTLWDINKQG